MIDDLVEGHISFFKNKIISLGMSQIEDARSLRHWERIAVIIAELHV
jgi:hypothetical protein